MSDIINNIFVEAPNQRTYDEYKSEISKDSVVFISDEDKIIANDKEYYFATQTGLITLIDGNNYTIAEIPILKKRNMSSYGYDGYYEDSANLLGDWGEPIVKLNEE